MQRLDTKYKFRQNRGSISSAEEQNVWETNIV